ncbi:MAG: penicillin-binding transpeptidase domain-containing protein, partial [Verrucomicrobiota bacterium]
TAESDGRVYPVKDWSITSFSSQVMGYEVAVTPLQMAVACNVIASGGMYLPPTIMTEVRDSDGEMIQSTKDGGARPRRVLSEKAAKGVRHCMVETMSEGGTGTKAALPGYSIAGKTGTARKYVENHGYVGGRYIASFMGFLPAENPELLGLIVIDNPKVEGSEVYGGSVAAPIFKAIAQDAVKVLEIAPDRPDELLSEALSEVVSTDSVTQGGLGR